MAFRRNILPPFLKSKMLSKQRGRNNLQAEFSSVDEQMYAMNLLLTSHLLAWRILDPEHGGRSSEASPNFFWTTWRDIREGSTLFQESVVRKSNLHFQILRGNMVTCEHFILLIFIIINIVL
jgi:hypothetical protein